MTTSDSRVLYKGGLVFTSDGQTQSHLAVMLNGARIENCAPVDEFAGFTGKTVDTTGATLLPGLIDCHVHMLFAGEADPVTAFEKRSPAHAVVRAVEHAMQTLRGGITSVRDCGGKDYLEFAIRDAVNEGRLTGPTMRAAGRMICMTGGHGNPHARVADGPQEVIKAVREQIHAGSDLIKIMATGGVMTKGVNPEDAHYSAEEMTAGVSEASRFGKTTASHAQGAEGILNATRAGITSIEHGIFLNDQCIEEMLSHGTFLVPTLTALDRIVNNDLSDIPDFIMEKAKRCAVAHNQSIKAFYDAGGKIAMGTDAGTPFNLHGENAMELALMVGIGMSASDAILASTHNAAELMRLDDRGQIAPGYIADILIVRGNPVENIQAVSDRTNHLHVIKDGVHHFDGC